MYCHKCGAQVDERAAFCEKCGTALQKTSPEEDVTTPRYLAAVQHAGFWRRLAASLIDGLLLGVAGFAILFATLVVYSLATGVDADEVPDNASDAIVYLSWAASAILGWIYYAAMEGSAKQATLGKMALGIVVTDVNGQRVSFGRASGRYFGKLLSGMMLGIGLIIIAFTVKKQGLHDIMADCLVVVKRRDYPQM